ISQKAQKGKKLNKYRKNNAVAISEKDDALEAHLVKEKNKSKEYKKENSSQNTAIADKDIAAPPVKEKTPTVPDAKALEKQKDSAAVAAAGPNALEELLKEKEQQTVREPKVNRWQIMPSVAPIYFSSVSGGSPIDPQLADNSKNYKKSMSYGISIEYALAKKWSVRTGVNKITLGYNTNDIIYYASLDKARIADSNQTEGSSLVVEDNTAANLLSFDNVPGKRSGYLNQKMGYIEVPVEVSYKILDRRFGIEAIGGMSAMFLNENRLSVISGGISASAGEASNLNSISFTSNIGLGFRYRFWKTFQANVEPKFKYQINTFSENAGGFKPYFIGIYSGISFSF
ncbi:MAG TPA: outer membrane beta-barrel protein, partial [Flavobacterium sp.]|nr:outer membrane beta-barrel protein [Flavobacterium sp.]